MPGRLTRRDYERLIPAKPTYDLGKFFAVNQNITDRHGSSTT
jgi:hypothetical protein